LLAARQPVSPRPQEVTDQLVRAGRFGRAARGVVVLQQPQLDALEPMRHPILQGRSRGTRIDDGLLSADCGGAD
jgi:hypothetical protein